MKQFLTVTTMVVGMFITYSQSLTYNDLGILFGQDNNYGTARFNAMSGAFGALGGDASAISINPAGGVVATNSVFSLTLGNRNNKNEATYGNTNNTNNYIGTTHSDSDSFTVSQAGGILPFNGKYKSNWNKFALSFNYRLKKDFNDNFTAQGNSGQALFNEHPDDNSTPINQYNNGQEQHFNSITDGQSSTFSLGFSAAHQNKLFLGANVNVHRVQFSQVTRLNETNQDNNGNTLNAFNEQISNIEGNGFSLSLGIIYKLQQNFRIGLAYESPTWYSEIIEDSNLAVFDPNNARYDDWIGYTEISASNISTDINSGEEFNLFTYSLRTPSKLTASTAFIFNKQGLISLDYSYKDYSNTQFNKGDFNNVNTSFNTNFKSVHAINIGTEWRFDKISLRAGYHFEQSPIKNSLNSNDIKGFSAGLGYNFGNLKFDIAYNKTKNTLPYYIYNSPNVSVDPINLSKNTSRITGTLTLSL